jgi:ElaB/YqjD/DUF883 family membrane-anchored ribosome-binding protein
MDQGPDFGRESWDKSTDRAVQGSTFDKAKEGVAERLESAAETLKESADEAYDEAAGYSRKAADWFERSAQQVRDFDFDQIRADFEDQVRRSPGRALLVAGAAGLVLGALLRRS